MEDRAKKRATSGEFMKMVKCGICVPEYEARRDYLQSTHFPKKHPGVGYIEKGERKITFGVAPKNTNNDEDAVADNINEYVADLDEDIENLNENIEDTLQEEVSLGKPAVDEAKDATGATNDNLMEEIVKLQKMLQENMKMKTEKREPDISLKLEEKCDLIQACKTVSELCMRAGLSTFESQGKVICDICTHDDLTDEASRRLGIFSYDMTNCGEDFSNKSQPREFRNLKKVVVTHYSSEYHMKINKDLIEKHNRDEKNEAYNYSVGLGRARQIYQNVKNKCSYQKYESDCLVSALNGEDIGNTNHSWMFAQEVVTEVAASIQIDLKKHFRTPLKCTGQLPPVGLATDKMTQKRH
jgi:hypothetical protein